MSSPMMDRIELMKRGLKASKGHLILHAQNPSDFHYWTKPVHEMAANEWLLLAELAEAALRIAEAIKRQETSEGAQS